MKQLQPKIEWSGAPLHELIRHIVLEYHDCLRLELPRLGQKFSNLPPALRSLQQELDLALNYEEESLFPAIRKCEQETEVQIRARAVGLRASISQAMRQNERLAGLFGDVQQEISAGLLQLAMDHVHLENEILYPRALALVTPSKDRL